MPGQTETMLSACPMCASACMYSRPAWWDPASLCLQLRVIRAFKSTLEDLEERRSVHSLHSLHSLRSSRSHTGPWPPRPLSDITYIDEDPANPVAQRVKDDQRPVPSPNTLRLPPHNAQYAPASPADLPKPVHETRI